MMNRSMKQSITHFEYKLISLYSSSFSISHNLITEVHIWKAMNRDVLLELAYRLDNTSLLILSEKKSIQDDMREVLSNQYFWYLRTQNLIGRSLLQRANQDWKKAYYALESISDPEEMSIISHYVFTDGILTSGLAVLILLELGYDPSTNGNQAIRHACMNGNIDSVMNLLEDKRADPAALDNQCIRTTATRGHTKIIDLLLNDGRVDPTISKGYVLTHSASMGRTKIVDLLLKDGRIDPRIENNASIKQAVANGRVEVVRLLLQDGRADPASQDNWCIKQAAAGGFLAMVRLLLSDPRVDPTAENNYALRAASNKGYRMIIDALRADLRMR